MVVPVERVARAQKPKRYIGNNLTLNIDENKSTIQLTGNNCKVVLEENNGKVKVVGDNCEIVILKGSGNVKYVGNCGKIVLGLGVSSDDVDYIGNQGNVTSVTGGGTTSEPKPKTENWNGNENQTNIKCSANSRRNINITDSNMVRITTSSHGVPRDFNINLPTDRCYRFQRVGLRK